MPKMIVRKPKNMIQTTVRLSLQGQIAALHVNGKGHERASRQDGSKPVNTLTLFGADAEVRVIIRIRK